MAELRHATPADERALRRLAERDCARVPAGPLIVAVEDGRIRAALAPGTGEAIADPFAPTAHLLEALRAYCGTDQPRTRSIFGSYRGSRVTSAPSQRPKIPTSRRSPTSTAAGRYA